ncbi:MAG: HDOD domain-containing protein [Acidobacteria bacterium]|nr:HDOD domain-containing protein [Acidobacteriota bacterium]
MRRPFFQAPQQPPRAVPQTPREPLRRPEPSPDEYRLKLLSAVNSIPPLPSTLNQLIGMLNNEMASAGQIASVIERDSVLSGSVLKCVNSAYYGLPNRVSSIRHAVTLLGFKTVRNLALAFSMRRMLTQSQPARALYGSYSRHALGCAFFTQFLASYTRSHDPEAAFAAGLFHDVGKLLIFTTAPMAVLQIIERWEAGEESWEDLEREFLHVTHSELSAIVLEAWKLPVAIQNAARYHHDPDACPPDPEQDPEKPALSLAWLVHAADAAVRSEGMEAVSSEHRPPEGPEEAFRHLGLESAASVLLEQFREEFHGLQGVFQ